MEKIFQIQIKKIMIKLSTYEEAFNACLTLIEDEQLPIEEVFSEIIKNNPNNANLQFCAFNFFKEHLSIDFDEDKLKSQLNNEVQLLIELQ